MKKLYIALVLLLPIALPLVSVSAGFDFSSAWKQWVHSRQNISHTVEVLTPVVEEKEIRTSSYSFTRNTLSRRPITVSRSTNASAPTVQARLTPIRPRTDVHTITDEPLQLFTIGVKNTTQGSNTTFVEPLLLEEATFRLFANSGIAEDVRHLELNIDGQTSTFDTDGRVTVQFNNARLAQGESLDFDVFIQMKDPSTTPHIPGTLRLRLDRMTAIGETSEKIVTVDVLGTATSSKIVFDPSPTITGSASQVSGNTYLQISGGTLEAGEEVYVLGANLSAYYDDLSLREITVRNVLTGSDIDSFIDRVEVINLNTKKVIGTGRFSNGEVKFQLSPRPFIGRNQQMSLGFKVTVADPMPHSSLDARFKLDISPANLFIESLTTGRPLSDANKQFSIDSQEFAISQGKMMIASASRQYPFAIDTGTPETVYRFTMNGGSNESALGRISLEAFPSGCEFDGGMLDAGDVELVRINGTREYLEETNITTSGNKITFDFPSELYLNKGTSVQFGLRLKLDNLQGNNDTDSVAVRILGDSNYASGTLASVRSSGSNFIWSDASARMHSETTSDWSSGYLVSGLPSNNKVVKRFGNE